MKTKNKMYIIRNKTLVTLNVYYWMPDYDNILQQFIWQTMDVKPKYPRINKFLDYWHNNIEAIVSEIQICESERRI
tara:strand:- start:3015 stop:3242 length:228 start_codon:yes stop_codon:yes gene_type:complete